MARCLTKHAAHVTPLSELTLGDIRAAGALIELKHPGCTKESRDYQWTLAHFLAAFGTERHMEHLCTQHPLVCNAVTLNGLTPYQVAVKYQNKSTATVLFSCCQHHFIHQ